MIGSRRSRPNAFIEIFMTAVSPGFIATSMMNNYYDTHEAYVFALARELKKEYEYIASRGFKVQESLLAFWVPFLAADLGNFFGGGLSSGR